MEQILGHIGNVGFLLGAYFLAKRNIHGFTSQILANLLYLFQAILMNNFSLGLLSIFLIIINIYGIYQWKLKY